MTDDYLGAGMRRAGNAAMTDFSKGPVLRHLEGDEPLKTLDPRHELLPTGPVRPQTSGEKIAEATIDHINKATDLTLDTLDKLEAKIVEMREKIQKSKIELHDAIRAHMKINEAAIESCNQIGKQIDIAGRTLITNGSR